MGEILSTWGLIGPFVLAAVVFVMACSFENSTYVAVRNSAMAMTALAALMTYGYATHEWIRADSIRSDAWVGAVAVSVLLLTAWLAARSQRKAYVL